MKVVRVLVAVVAASVLLPLQSVLAAHAMETSVSKAGQDSILTIKGQLGILNGESHELVYGGAAAVGSEDYKISELIWDLKDVMMAGAVASLGNSGPLALNIGLWAGVNEGVDGEMFDYDWMDDTRPDWTDRSRSEVDVITALMFDANLSLKVAHDDGYVLAVVGGLMVDIWEWEDRGQEFTYSVNAFRDVTDSFNGLNVIDYKQTFVIPYVGVEGAVDLGGLSVEGYLLYSPAVIAEDEDYHILRELHFKETFTGGEYLAFGLSATLDIGKNLFLQASVEHEAVDEIIGDMEIVETNEGVTDGAGISYESTMISAAIGIRL